MSAREPQLVLADRFPVAVIIAQEPVQNMRWVSERWTVLGVVAGQNLTDGSVQRKLIRTGREGNQYLWSGFTLQLLRSAADSYYFNLMGKSPSVYVVCHRDEGKEITPFLTTVEYIEATAYGEVSTEVFAVPMPPEIYRWVEQFVLENYVPEEKKSKRKHADGFKDGHDPKE
ncbi:MAG TPA: DUF3305 domain-containing protein [Acidiferrobacterales bacterium]|nr:DUF3305 domain-containing protein [Acidiferrobacterales bacterium]